MMASLPPSAGRRGPEERPLVICVDDELRVLAALNRLLREEPFEQIITQDPDEVLELVERKTVSLVVADQCMPRMSGTHLLRLIRQASPRTRGLLLSGHATLDDIASDIRDGTVGCFIRKPWDPSDLRSVLRRLLGLGSATPRRTPGYRRLALAPDWAPIEKEELFLRWDCSGQTLPEIVVRMAALLSSPSAMGGGRTIVLENPGVSGESVAGLFSTLLFEIRHARPGAGPAEGSGAVREELLDPLAPSPAAAPRPGGRRPENCRILLLAALDSPSGGPRLVVSAGHALWTATEALRRMGPVPFDFVLLGPVSGDPRWTEFARRVLARRLRIPVVALPEDATTGLVAEAIRHSKRGPDPD